MKSKKIVSLIMVASLAALATVSASAQELTPSTPDGSAEVTAKIEGAGPGEVSYVITIPDKIDFGTLEYSDDTETDNFKDVSFSVEATEINNLPENQWVNVYVKYEGATDSDDQFYIVQKTEPNTKLTYDVYAGSPDTVTPVNHGDMGENGFLLVSFDEVNEAITGTLRLNQKQIAGKDLDVIAGDYSGLMVFHSAIGAVI